MLPYRHAMSGVLLVLASLAPTGAGVAQRAPIKPAATGSELDIRPRGDVEQELRRWDALTSRSDRAAQAHWEVARLLMHLQSTGAPRLASAGTFDGEAYADAIMRHLGASLRAKGVTDEVRAVAAHALLARGERAPTKPESDVLQILLKLPAYRPIALVVAAREARQRGRHDDALRTLRHARELGLDPGLALFEQSRTLASLGRLDDAAAAYWASTSTDSPAGLALLAQDLAWIASPDSVADFRGRHGAKVRQWLEAFWRRRDADVAAVAGERLKEHLRRWAVVHDSFRVHLPDRRTQFARVELGFEGLDQCVPNASATYARLADAALRLALPGDLRADEPLLDHRALVYMRHGAPALVIAGRGHGNPYRGRPVVEVPDARYNRRVMQQRADEMDESMATNASWLYFVDGRWTFLHFRGSKALGLSAPTTLSTYLPVMNVDGATYTEDWRLRAQVLADYGKAASIIARPPGQARAVTCEGAVEAVIAASRESTDSALVLDSNLPMTLAARNAMILHHGVGARGATRAGSLISWAIPSSVLDSLGVQAGNRGTTLRIRTVARDVASGAIQETEALREVGYRLDGRRDEYLVGLTELPLPGGRWRAATRITGPDGTVLAFGSDSDVVVPDASEPALSDLLIGRADGSLRWRRSGEEVSVDALDTWRTDQPIQLFVELYGMPLGTAYQLEVRVVPQAAGIPGGLALTSKAIGAGEPEAIQRTLDVSRFAPGRYDLSVSVRVGERIVTSRRLLILRGQ